MAFWLAVAAARCWRGVVLELPLPPLADGALVPPPGILLSCEYLVLDFRFLFIAE